MNQWTTIAIFAAAQGVFLGLCLLLIQRGNRQANRYLACLILAYSLWMAEFAAYFTEYLYRIPHALFVTIGLPLLFGPLLLFYAANLSKPRRIRTGPFVLHLVPFILHTIYYSTFFILPAEHKTEMIRGLQNIEAPPDFSFAFYINESLKFLILLGYVGYVFNIYLKWSSGRGAKDAAGMHKNWLGMLLIALGFFAVFDLFHLLSLYLFAYDYLFVLAKLILGSGAVVLYFIGYATLRRPELISKDPRNTKNKPRYQKSSLPPDKLDGYKNEIFRLMNEEHMYTDPDFNLGRFAKKLDLSTHHLSQILNEYMHTSFHELVNGYRVQQTQKMLSDPQYNHLTILSIAYDAGFNSKASFNTVFKKMTGMTPSAYKKAHVVEES